MTLYPDNVLTILLQSSSTLGISLVNSTAMIYYKFIQFTADITRHSQCKKYLAEVQSYFISVMSKYYLLLI